MDENINDYIRTKLHPFYVRSIGVRYFKCGNAKNILSNFKYKTQ